MTKDNNTEKTAVVKTAVNKVVTIVKPVAPYAIGAAAAFGLQLAWKVFVKPLISGADPTFDEIVDSAIAVANES